MSHELYNCGHLYEAACAHHLATGSSAPCWTWRCAARRSSAVSSARTGRHDTCGHQIVERGLAQLCPCHRRPRPPGAGALLPGAAGTPRRRGPCTSYEDNPAYCQDHLPVRRAARGRRPRGARGLHVRRHGRRGGAPAGRRRTRRRVLADLARHDGAPRSTSPAASARGTAARHSARHSSFPTSPRTTRPAQPSARSCGITASSC